MTAGGFLGAYFLDKLPINIIRVIFGVLQVLAGGYLLFFYGESVRTFYPIPCGKTIFSPNLVEGDTVTFTVSKGKEIPVGAGGVRQTLTLTTGG